MIRFLFRCTPSFALALAACTPPAPPPQHLVISPPRQASPPDLFHRQLAMAQHARAVHAPAADKAGAQRAYYAIMVPACDRVARIGPDKYRSRCRALIGRATAAAPSRTASAPASAPAIAPAPTCDLDRDDSGDTPAQITACSD